MGIYFTVGAHNLHTKLYCCVQKSWKWLWPKKQEQKKTTNFSYILSNPKRCNKNSIYIQIIAPFYVTQASILRGNSQTTALIVTHLHKYEAQTTTHTVAITNAQKIAWWKKTVTIQNSIRWTSKHQRTHTLDQILATRCIKGGTTKWAKWYTKAELTCVRIKNMQNITAGTKIWKIQLKAKSGGQITDW